MRVLQICSGNLYGGVETTIVTLARYGAETCGVHFDFTVCFEARLSEELRSRGARVTNLGRVRVRNPISVWRVRANLRKLLSTCHYDAAICHSAWSHAIFGPVLRQARVPLLFWLHGAPSGRDWLGRWAARIRPARVICCSHFTANIAKNLFPGIASDVVYPPLTHQQIRSESTRLAIRSELKTPLDAMVVIQVGRIEKGKGHLRLLQALAMLNDIPNWICWVVGGPQRPEESLYLNKLREAATQRGISDRIRFIGERADVPLLMNAADLFCQPNISPEGFGQVFVEALMCGLPVVTSAIGGGLEILDSTCGVLTPPEDVAQVASSLRMLMTDSKLRARMSDAAPARARMLCEPKRQVARLAEVIEGALVREGTA